MAVFMLFLVIGEQLGLGPWEYPLRAILLTVVLWIFSRRVIDLRDDAARAPELTGSKAAALATAVASGLRVLPGVVLTTDFSHAVEYVDSLRGDSGLAAVTR